MWDYPAHMSITSSLCLSIVTKGGKSLIRKFVNSNKYLTYPYGINTNSGYKGILCVRMDHFKRIWWFYQETYTRVAIWFKGGTGQVLTPSPNFFFPKSWDLRNMNISSIFYFSKSTSIYIQYSSLWWQMMLFTKYLIDNLLKTDWQNQLKISALV